jgi:carboxylesterase type B
LFHRAILQSGSALCPWAFTRNAGHQAKRFAKSLNCPTDNSSVLIACLKKMNPIKLVHPHSAIMSPIHLQDDLFVGSVEATKTNDTFLSENPFHLLSTGNFNKVPIIFGVNGGEGGLKTSRLEAFPEILSKIDEKWNEYVPILLHYDPARKDISEKIREYYFKNSTTISSDVATLTKMISDGIFFHATHWTAKLHSKWAPVYLYYYTYRSSLPSVYSAMGAIKNSDDRDVSGIKLVNAIIRDFLRQYFQQSKYPKRFGPCHGEELLLLWDLHWASEIGTMGTDFVFSKALVTNLVSFAQSIEHLTFRNISWPSVNQTSKELIYMELNKTPRIIQEPFQSSMAFWDSLDVRKTQDNHNW